MYSISSYLSTFLLSFILFSSIFQFTNADQNKNQASIAYFIQISDATMTLLPRLLKSLWHPQNVYVIHFDKKIPPWQREHAQTSLFNGHNNYHDNVKLMESEIVTYRGISMVLNILNAMQFALNMTQPWDYWINISGSDYPLISPTNQRKLLATHDFLEKQRSFFSISEKDWWKDSEKYRFTRLFIDTSLSFNDSESKVVDSFTDQPISKMHNFTWIAAETWMILHRSYIDYLLKSPFARRMLLAFSYAIEPEEHYFATVAYNTPHINATIVPHAMRLVIWKFQGVHSGQHPYFIDQQTKEDKSWMFSDKVKESGCFFARKIRIPDSGFLKFIDTHVSGISSDANQADVKSFLESAGRTLQCVSHLQAGEVTDHCLPDDDDEEEK